MNELKIFQSPKFGTIRTLTVDNEPWFVGKDVAEILGYSRTNKLQEIIYAEDKQEIDPQNSMYTGLHQNGATLEPNKNVRRMLLINESGLYQAIFGSTLPKAKEFKRWVTSEVLPSIRKHGAYMTEETLQRAITSPDFLIKLATELKQEQNARKLAEQQVKELTPKGIFADAVSASKQSILVGELAKLLRQNWVEIGQNKLFAWLREHGYLIKAKRSDYSMPTQRAMNMKLFEIKETAITHSDGHVSVNKTVKVTGKGQVYFVNLFLRAVEAGH